MPTPTIAARAARARSARTSSARAPLPGRDPCPLCAADLSKGQGLTRRLVVFSGTRGSFTWRCPDCRGTWSEPAAPRGSTTRAAACGAAAEGTR